MEISTDFSKSQSKILDWNSEFSLVRFGYSLTVNIDDRPLHFEINKTEEKQHDIWDPRIGQ